MFNINTNRTEDPKINNFIRIIVFNDTKVIGRSLTLNNDIQMIAKCVINLLNSFEHSKIP